MIRNVSIFGHNRKYESPPRQGTPGGSGAKMRVRSQDSGVTIIHIVCDIVCRKTVIFLFIFPACCLHKSRSPPIIYNLIILHQDKYSHNTTAQTHTNNNNTHFIRTRNPMFQCHFQLLHFWLFMKEEEKAALI